jgi:hypothetical protein
MAEEVSLAKDVMVFGEEGGSGHPDDLEANKNDGGESSIRLVPCVLRLWWRARHKYSGSSTHFLFSSSLSVVSRRKIDL